MSKRIIFSIVSLVLILVISFSAWRLFGPATGFSGEKYDLYIRTGMNYEQVLALLEKDTVVKSPAAFNWMAGRLDYRQNVKAGKYEIKKDMSLLSLLRMLRNGRQTPVHFTIAKVRTHEGLASMIGRKFECDSASVQAFIANKDSLAPFGVDSNTFLTIIFPNTYTYFWNTTPSAIFKKMYASSRTWWTAERRQQAESEGLTPTTAYILASIVEEETNATADKGKIASVYLNRMARGMKLGADPTIKFAMRNFELKRIYTKYTLTPSPYNTYLYPGLPPGPICTPTEQTLTAVLEAPKTDYLFFVAKPDLQGYSNFAATYKEHLQYRKEYQEALNKRGIKGQETDSAESADPADSAANEADKKPIEPAVKAPVKRTAVAPAKHKVVKPAKRKHR
ncbi:MAG TPA: endolytic transglycosylase MltG [Puia sp.]|nr:endolytic transglycosylase MltG [Puia sp.]